MLIRKRKYDIGEVPYGASWYGLRQLYILERHRYTKHKNIQQDKQYSIISAEMHHYSQQSFEMSL